MTNISKFGRLCSVALAALACSSAISAEAFIFDNPFLVAMHSGNSIYGYYDSRDERFSCSFLFSGIGKIKKINEKFSNQIDIETYSFDFQRTSFAYKDRDKLFDVSGDLFIRSGKWVIRTKKPQGACNGIGADFGKAPDDPAVTQFSVEKQIDVIGIGIASKKTFFYRKPGAGKENRFLLRGDIALIISKHGDYTYVRFANPNTVSSTRDPVITGWIRSADLKNPLPPLDR
jgi:hypothetical protein